MSVHLRESFWSTSLQRRHNHTCPHCYRPFAPLVMILDQLCLGYHGASYIHDDLYQQMYSCMWFTGPKNEERRMYGLSHYHKPWEKSESSLFLLEELSGVSGCGDRVSSLLPLCAETLQHRHYPQHINLLETLLKLFLWY
ncbi:uncharacterized protein LOC135349878 isoform X2 [Halichondria panicea]|uniref:uncharacterized protein LOC135349878 isoform X2 n=1 Tax=Halichondria panicea TaxID=6063 RepID=UPI00312B564B